MTFSLLPDCLAARLPGSLDEVERVVVAVEAGRSVEAVASELRLSIELPGALRWVRRRALGVRVALVALVTLLPSLVPSLLPPGTQPQVTQIRALLGTDRALVALRGAGARYLGSLPRPLGFGPAPKRARKRGSHLQHETGTDPPGTSAV